MGRSVIPEYFPEKCFGCETLGTAITARDEALSAMNTIPSRRQINIAERVGSVTRELCETAEARCLGLAVRCIYEQPNE